MKILNIFLKLYKSATISDKQKKFMVSYGVSFIVFVQRNIFANAKICKSVRWKRLEYTDDN